MLRKKGLALAAVCAAFVCGGSVRAADNDAADTTPSYSLGQQPVSLDDAPARKPLMSLLDKAGVAKFLDDAGINIYGYVEGSWTKSFSSPPNNFITGRAFDWQSDTILLNQLDLTVERTVDITKKKFDVGFRIEQIYGADAAMIHSNGLTTYSPSKIGFARQPDRAVALEPELNIEADASSVFAHLHGTAPVS